MRHIQSLCAWDTIYSADSIEWCPDQEYHDHFICGTYKLEENQSPASSSSSSLVDDQPNSQRSQQRVGRLYLFQYQNAEPCLLKKQAIEMPAILDCKWCPIRINGKVLLAVANAKGKICIYQLCCDDSAEEEPKLSILVENEVPNSTEEDVLSLSVDWSPRLNCNSYDKVYLAVSDSKGCISIFTLDDNSLKLLHNWKSHEFEAWIVSFNRWNDSVLYTGGDDCRLCVYDIRCGTDRPISVSRLHTAGVTSMNYSSFNEHRFISGSYDENILLWDTRQMKRNIGSVNVGGGVWRLKWEPNKEKYILAACMYNGFRIIDCINETNLEISAEFNEHKSIAYGADWSHMSSEYLKDNISSLSLDREESMDLKLISTCSFYDHKLFVSFFN